MSLPALVLIRRAAKGSARAMDQLSGGDRLIAEAAYDKHRQRSACAGVRIDPLSLRQHPSWRGTLARAAKLMQRGDRAGDAIARAGLAEAAMSRSHPSSARVVLAPTQRWLPIVSAHSPTGQRFASPAEELRHWFCAMRTWFGAALGDRWREERLARDNMSPATLGLWQQAMEKHERRQALRERATELDVAKRKLVVLGRAIHKAEQGARWLSKGLKDQLRDELTLAGLCWAHRHHGGRLVHDLTVGVNGKAVIVEPGRLVVAPRMYGREGWVLSHRTVSVAVDAELHPSAEQGSTKLRIGRRMVTVQAMFDGRLRTIPGGEEFAALRAVDALAGLPDRYLALLESWRHDVRAFIGIEKPKLKLPLSLREAARLAGIRVAERRSRGHGKPEGDRKPQGRDRLVKELAALRHARSCEVILRVLRRAEPVVTVSEHVANSLGSLPGEQWVTRSEGKYWDKGHKFPTITINTTVRLPRDWYSTVFQKGLSEITHDGHQCAVLAVFRDGHGREMAVIAHPGRGKNVEVSHVELEPLLRR